MLLILSRPLQEWKAEAARRGKQYLLSMATAAYTPNLVGEPWVLPVHNCSSHLQPSRRRLPLSAHHLHHRLFAWHAVASHVCVLLCAGIDMAAAKQHLDFLNIMSYDYHGSWDAATNFMAPWSDPAVGSLVGKL